MDEFTEFASILPDWVNEENFNFFKINHSAEHILTMAMEELWPGKIKRAMGPAISQGFYFDFSSEEKITEEDFPKIEEKMNEIIKRNLPFVRRDITEEQAKDLFKDNKFKIEFVKEFVEKGRNLSVYYTGTPEDATFVDLCAGPHVKYTKKIKAFKLLSIAGAYWRGDEKNEMLTRIYGVAFDNKESLELHLEQLKDAAERDHRKVNDYMDIFAFSELVGRGLVMYTPRGTLIKNLLKEHLFKISKRNGAVEVNIPHMAKIDLYEKSGHAKKFKDELFKVTGHYNNEYVLKPVNCPHHTQIYASRQRSYKDLPIAYIESTQQHRDEKPGAMSGLNRTVSFEVDDGHTFCTPEQIKEEAIKIINTIKDFYTSFGMWGNHWVSLSFRDLEKPENYIGNNADWDIAERMLEEINDELKLNGKIMLGEAALYGPKIDFMLKDALGNDRQLGTVQIDFAMPKNFNLEYTDKDGQKKTPVMLHRAILGSYQRFIANLMENTKGAFPFWLAPEQIRIIPIGESQIEYAKNIQQELLQNDLRVNIDDSEERMQNKIRKAQNVKIPYMIILGEKEIEGNNISIRTRNENEFNNIELNNFIEACLKQNNQKTSILTEGF